MLVVIHHLRICFTICLFVEFEFPDIGLHRIGKVQFRQKMGVANLPYGLSSGTQRL